jgi:hypothetical protein
VWIPVLLNLTWSKSSFTRGTLILCQSPGLAAMLGNDGTDSALEYMLSRAHGLLWPCPVIPSA